VLADRRENGNFMEKIFVIALLIPLILFEAYLCTAFLPLPWQRAVTDVLVRLLPASQTPVTHPMLSQEIEQVLSENVWLKVGVLAITLLLLAVNAWAIRRLLRLLRRGRSAPRSV
jgi:hypothetical protein